MRTVIRLPVILLVVTLLAVSACSSRSGSDHRSGQPPAATLPPQELLELVQDHSLRIRTFGEDVTLYFAPSGRLAAMDYSHNEDSGRWDVSEAGELCIKLSSWWYSDLRCFTVRPEGKGFALLRGDRGLAYQAEQVPANPPQLLALVNELAAASKQRISYRKTVEESIGDRATEAAAPTDQGRRSSFRRDQQQTGAGSPEASAGAGSPDEGDRAPSALPGAPPMNANELKNTVRWLARDCPGCNMEQADLRAADLVAADLQGTNLRGANLREANLRRARLQGANLEAAVLEQANLPGADLRGANLRRANLRGANLIRADLTGADLRECDMQGALLEGIKGLK